MHEYGRPQLSSISDHTRHSSFVANPQRRQLYASSRLRITNIIGNMFDQSVHRSVSVARLLEQIIRNSSVRNTKAETLLSEVLSFPIVFFRFSNPLFRIRNAMDTNNPALSTNKHMSTT